MRLFPGVRLNFSGSGISTSIGGRGAHITIGHGHVRETVGIPGTGISYTTISKHHGNGPPAQRRGGFGGGLILLALFGFIVLIASNTTHEHATVAPEAHGSAPAPGLSRPKPVQPLPPAEPHTHYFVAVDALNLRDRPNGAVVGVLRRGSQVDVFETTHDWARVSMTGYPPRWVYARMLCAGADCASTGNR